VPLRRAAVVGGLEGWRTGLAAAGVEVVGDPGGADAAIADAGGLEAALSAAPQVLLVEGGRRVERAGHAVDRYLPLAGLERPGLFVPLGRPGPVRYALRRAAAPTVRWKRGRNRVLETLLGRGRFPPLRPLVSVAARRPAPPFLVAAAQELGVPARVEWLLAPGSDDPLGRGIFLLFRPGEDEPAWALKFARVPGYTDAFDRDERGFTIARAGGPVVTAHAPELLGRIEAAGLHASVETAAVGELLVAYLHSPAPEGERLAAVERIAAWLVDVARATAAAPEALEPERRRLADEILPAYPRLGARSDLAAVLPPLPAVLQHNDLGSWNVVVDGERFTALDWEAARTHGFPLWDLWYLLADALAQLDGPATLAEQERHFVRLFTGRLPGSSVLFRWTRITAEASRVPADAVGPLATLCWLHHGRSHVDRSEAIRRHTGGGEAPVFLARRAPELWLSEPALGPAWSAWRGSS
jgi:hypothetical protein